VRIGRRGAQRIVSVRDDGVGFDEADTAAAGQGLQNMRRRAETIDGGFELRSGRGRGTAVEVTLRA
jgi:signal transduction histidine kinase